MSRTGPGVITSRNSIQHIDSNILSFVKELDKFTIGFTPTLLALNDMIDRTPSYPPYNLEQVSDTNYILTLAVAGFVENDINVEQIGRQLVIIGNRSMDWISTPDITEERIRLRHEERNYIYQGIAGRNFKRTFYLDKNVKVREVTLQNGLLEIHIEKEIPEEEKPRLIPINVSSNLKKS